GLAAGAQLPLHAIKETVDATAHLPEAEAMRVREGLDSVRRVKASEDQVEGARAFAEGRDPVWRGR
ncbi:MAG: carnitinyl-CoA dehydratase, partial [Actinomycetota bacterium]